MGPTAEFGSTNEQIRATIKAKYASKGIKLMVSAFGATEHPTTTGYNPTTCANNLADYVLAYDLDGIDLDYEDSAAF